MSTKRRRSLHSAPKQRDGFTLVEMLVSVSLVMLMMVLFAQIFSHASNAMTLQRAIADNDQNVRTFTTVLRSDLAKRTFRTVTPYHPKENGDLQVVAFGDRDGYFYISLNDPDDQTDNVLQFTVRSTIKLESGDETPYVGKAAALSGTFLQNPNQPEHDDGQIDPNGAATSTVAEICYFMRGRNLYRRVVLVREPLPASGADDVNPRHESSREWYFDPNATSLPALYNPTTRDVWQEFDFSMFNGALVSQVQAALPNDPVLSKVVVAHVASNFIGTEALNNGPSVGAALGQSRFRFGFDVSTGLPREYLTATGNPLFMGRFTLEEMSMMNFEFPQAPSHDGSGTVVGSGNPYDGFNTALNDANGNYVIDEFEPFYVGQNAPSGTNVEPTRRGEDLLLSNVHGFDIEVWDSRVGAFLPVGHSEFGAGADRIPGTADDMPGDYHSVRWLENLEAQNPSYRAPGGESRIFDTWHPQYNRDGVTTTGIDPQIGQTVGYDLPPYRALVYYPPDNAAGGIQGYQPPFVNDNQAHSGYWEPNRMYEVGDRIFPVPQQCDPTDPTTCQNPQAYSMYYVCNRAGTSSGTEPAWKLTPGPMPDPPLDSVPPEPRWTAVRNVIPLQTIRITVRFRHVASNQMRQLTLIHSLVD